MKYYILFFFIVLGSSCRQSNHQTADPLCKFLKSKNYEYCTNKNDIPDSVVRLLIKSYNGDFALGDRNSLDSICLTDDCNSSARYTKELNFILKSDSICLLSYTKGGVGVSGVIDFYKYKGEFLHIQNKYFPPIKDTIMLFSMFSSCFTK